MKKRILTVCVKLFLEQGYKKTTVAQIVAGADVSNSSFQNIFKAKDGVLTDLVNFVFGSQYSVSRKIVGNRSPLYVYAVDCALQLALTELNDNLREIYVEAYSHEGALSAIHEHCMEEMRGIFAPYLPDITEDEFYALEVGTAGLVRAFMDERCSERMSLERKLDGFLTLNLRGLKVPEQEIRSVLNFIHTLDIEDLAEEAMDGLFKALSMHYEFSLHGIKTETHR